MSGGGNGAGPGRAIQLAVLLALGGLLWLVQQSGVAARLAGAGTVTSVGFLLLAGALTASLLELVALPHLTGYLLAGALAGPHLLHLVDHRAVVDLEPVNALALSLIALAGGAELRLDGLRQGLRSLGWATLLHNLPVILLVGGAFYAARPLLPFAQGLSAGALLAAALLWGVTAVTRSPSATLGIISQTRARGPLTTSTINFVMSSDVVVVVLLALALTVARPMAVPGAALSAEAFGDLGHELLGSLSVGVTLGLLLIAYLRWVGGRLLLVLVALGLVLTQVMDYLALDWLLVFITAGFVVRNLSRHGDAFQHSIEGAGEVIYVIFFAIAGAHLDLPLLATLWPMALLLAGARALATWGAGTLTGRLAEDPPALRRWGFAGLISQAGLALGIASRVASQFPEFGAGFASLAVAVVAMNEVAGPILFKLAIVKAGEAAAAEDTSAEGAVEPEQG